MSTGIPYLYRFFCNTNFSDWWFAGTTSLFLAAASWPLMPDTIDDSNVRVIIM